MVMARKGRQPGDPIIIKKYANRRLYNTATSSYVTLDHLADLVKDNEDFVVVDAKSGEDITHSVLTQIIFEKEQKDESTMLPLPFLRQLISFYGDGLQAVVPGYLQYAMENLTKNQEQMRKAFTLEGGSANFVPVIEEMTRQNMAMFQQAMRMFTPGAYGTTGPSMTEDTSAPAAPAGEEKGEKDKELKDLQAELAALKSKVDALTR